MKNPFAVLFERRNAIASSYELAQYLLGGTASVSGQRVSESTALNVAAVWTGIAIRSRLLASLPIDVIEAVDARTRRQVPDDPVARVLARPNAWQTGPEFIALLETHRLLRGEGFAWVNWVRVPGSSGERVPVELVPLHPDRMDVLEPDNEVMGGASRYRYTTKRGQTWTFSADEVLHVQGLSTDGRRARNFMADMRELIGGALATQEHANGLWSRDATPTIVLKHPATLGAVAKTNLEDGFAATYGQGHDKKRVAVLEEGMQLERLSLTPEDGQFLQTQQDLRAQIAAALMVPPHLMGLSEKATTWGTGIEQMNIGLLTLTLTPDVTTYEHRLNRTLFQADSKRRVKFNVRGMLRGDIKSQAAAHWQYRQMGVYSADDIRAHLDENPLPSGGDVYLQPVNLAPLGTEPNGGSVA